MLGASLLPCAPRRGGLSVVGCTVLYVGVSNRRLIKHSVLGWPRHALLLPLPLNGNCCCCIHVGALVSGPDASDGYADLRTNMAQSAVSLDGNVYLCGLLAGLLDRHVKAGQCHGGRGASQHSTALCFFSAVAMATPPVRETMTGSLGN